MNDDITPLEPPPPDEAYRGDPGPGGGAARNGGGGYGGGGYGGGRPNGTSGRMLPHSMEAEVSVLGSALISRHAATSVLEILSPEDFYRSAHGVVFEAIQDLATSGTPVDTVTVLEWARNRHRLDEIGGPTAVSDLAAAAPTAANAEHYAKIVKDNALLRRLIEAGTEVVRMGFDDTEDAIATVDRAESVIFRVAEQGANTDYAALKDMLPEAFERLEALAHDNSEVTGLPTGFDDLDRLTAGLQPENLIILAARPAMGKCVVGATRVSMADGRMVRMDDLVEMGLAGKPVEILALDSTGRLVPAAPSEFHDNGEREVVRLSTRYGRSLVATTNHPMLTPSGWRHLEELEPGDLVATPRQLPITGCDERSPAEVRLLGYLIGDGCLVGATPTVTTASEEVEAELATLAPSFGLEAIGRDTKSAARTVTLRSAVRGTTAQDVADAVGVSTRTVGSSFRRDGVVSMGPDTAARVSAAIDNLGYDGRTRINHLTEWLVELGLMGLDAHGKHVPEVVFRLPNSQVAEFLSRLYTCDGSAWIAEGHGYFGISYTSVSERLARDVQHLLLRLGIISRVRARQVAYVDTSGVKTRRPAYEVEIRDAANTLAFLDRVGIFAKDEACDRVRAAASARGAHTNLDLLPIETWGQVITAKGDRTWADVSAGTGRPRNHNWHVGQRRPSRRIVGQLAEVLDDARLRSVATDDVLWDEVVAIEPAGTERVYDITVPEHHCFVANDLIVHNSSLALNLAQYVTVSLKKPSIIFSLEMSKIEIVNRMLSAEAGIDSNKIKTGRFDDRDWRRLGDALGRLNDAPLFIDDTPSISMLEITAKCRRLKQKHGLSLVVIDYLQLMSSHGRSDSRQQEVAEISRGLKMLAKDLKVPVIALSQLSRQPESRVDKRPMLSDLRESGCLTRNTRVFRADTGAPITFGELIDGDMRDIEVWARDERERLVPARMMRAFPSGTKEAFLVRTASGMTVEATANHPFLTLDGWRPLGELGVGSRVAVARTLPEPANPQPMDPDELILLAHMLGEGTMVARQPVHYTSADADNLDVVEKAAWNRFGITARRDADGRSALTTQLHLPSPVHLTHGVRNPIAAWLDTLGLWDRRSWQKHLPAEVFALPDDQVRTFLHHLWATDGCIWVRPAHQTGLRVRAYYATASAQLAKDVQLALLRLGIASRIARPKGRAGTRQQHHVTINGVTAQRRFLEQVGCHGERGRLVGPALAALADVEATTNADTIPREIWDRVRALLREQGISQRAFAEMRGRSYGGTALFKSSVGRDRLAQIAGLLDDERLADLATSDMMWDEIVEVTSMGQQEVFDATVEGHHSFVAEGVVLHNSIEQDADIVGFIYRDEVYDEQSPDKGIAELIIAKHRNGQVRTVRLAFLNHLTKFANLAQRPPGSGGGGGMGGPPPPPPPPESPL